MAKKKMPAKVNEILISSTPPDELMSTIEAAVVTAMGTNEPQQIILELESGEFVVMLFTKV